MEMKQINKVSIALKPNVYSTFRNLNNTVSNTLGEYVDNAVQSFLYRTLELPLLKPFRVQFPNLSEVLLQTVYLAQKHFPPVHRTAGSSDSCRKDSCRTVLTTKSR